MSETSEVKIAVVESRLDNHEKVCGERYSEISKSFESVTGKLDKIMYGFIGLSIVIIGYLIVNGLPWVKV